jgi:hypothetical protein
MKHRRRLLLVLVSIALVLCAVVVGVKIADSVAGGKVVLERGSLGKDVWQLVAWEQNGQLAMQLTGASEATSYSGTVGFDNSPSGGYWAGGLGPANSNFYYGPAPSAAEYAVLSSPGHRSLVVPTHPLPNENGLPGGRFWIINPSGPVSVVWQVRLRNRFGRPVGFVAF